MADIQLSPGQVPNMSTPTGSQTTNTLPPEEHDLSGNLRSNSDIARFLKKTNLTENDVSMAMSAILKNQGEDPSIIPNITESLKKTPGTAREKIQRARDFSKYKDRTQPVDNSIPELSNYSIPLPHFDIEPLDKKVARGLQKIKDKQ